MNRRCEPVALHVQLVLELFQDSFVHNPYFPISLSPYYFPMSLFPVSQLNTFQVIGGTLWLFSPQTPSDKDKGASVSDRSTRRSPCSCKFMPLLQPALGHAEMGQAVIQKTINSSKELDRMVEFTSIRAHDPCMHLVVIAWCLFF